MWQARNLPNDELDLQIPIYDTDICHLNENFICVTTGYGDVRDYDTRGQRRPSNSVKVTKDKEQQCLLGKITPSVLKPEHLVFVSTQEGHIVALDRRMNFRVIRKLMGNKGSVRALTSFVGGDGREYVVSAGCDRHVRIFESECEMQKTSETAHCYVK